MIRPGSDDEAATELTELLESLRELDPDALTRCYELTADLLAAVAMGIVRDRGTAEDLVQETFLRLVRSAPDLHTGDGRGLRAWLVRTVRNLAIDRTRSASWQREQAMARLPETDVAAPADDAVTRAVADPAMSAAIRQLTEDQRTALLLRYVGGLAGDEIGQILGRTRAAVYTLLRRAERRLRSLLPDPSDRCAPDRLHGDRP